MEDSVVSIAEFHQNFERYQGEALKQPVAITCDGKVQLVLLAAEEYRRLKQRDRVAFKSSELSESTIAAIANSSMDARHNHLDDELK